MSACVAASLLLLLLFRPFLGDHSHSREKSWNVLAGTKEKEEPSGGVLEKKTGATAEGGSWGGGGGGDREREGEGFKPSQGGDGSVERARSAEEEAPLLEGGGGGEEVEQRGAAAAAVEVAEEHPPEVSLKGGGGAYAGAR